MDECRRLLQGCDPKFGALVRAALETGARYGELTRLVVADFNADVGTVTIGQSKSGKPRHVVLTEDGIAFFKAACKGRSPSEPVFLKDNGSPWGKSHQLRPMAAACKRATG
jgi:integrase